MTIFYKRSSERYLPFLLLGCLHDAMSNVLEGLNLVQPDRVMFNSKLQTPNRSLLQIAIYELLCAHKRLLQ
jgi:hypothetical protein